MSGLVNPAVAEDSEGMFKELFHGDEFVEIASFGELLMLMNFCWTWPQSKFVCILWGMG